MSNPTTTPMGNSKTKGNTTKFVEPADKQQVTKNGILWILN